MRKHALKHSSKNKWLMWVVIAIVLSGTGYYYYNKIQSNKNSKPAVATSTIGTGDIVLSATGPGTIIPSEEVSFGFKGSGIVSEVLVKLGDKVKAGQVLARLENTTLELQYKQAEANLAALSSPSGIAVAEQTIATDEASLTAARYTLQGMIGPDLLTAEDNVANIQQQVQLAKAVAEKDPSKENEQKITDAQTSLAKAEEILTSVKYNYASNYTLQTFTYPVRSDKGVTTKKQLIRSLQTLKLHLPAPRTN